MRTIEWQHNTIRLIDQRALPGQVIFVECRTCAEVAQAIQSMAVRGAPAIGVAAAMGMALAACQSAAQTMPALMQDLAQAAALLRAARPTAVNLTWAIEQMLAVAARPELDTRESMCAALVATAQALADADVAINKRMGAHGATVISDGDTILHHCNTGGLAAVDYGTALGAIRCAHEQGKQVHVLVDETRPRLQGARLTAWELQQWNIPFTLIADGAAGYFLRSGRLNLVMFGADRIAANGDVVNKIGTYSLAVVARENGVPVYCVAPTSTVDTRQPTGDTIPIEERDPHEITHIHNIPIAPENCPAANPAFDVTPQRYLTGIVTENGIAYPPFTISLRRLMQGALYE